MTNTNTNGMPYAIFSYVHHNRQSASLVKIHCKTDFALRTDVIGNLGKQLAMQVVAMGKFDGMDSWIFDSSKTVSSVIQDAKDQLGEDVVLGKILVQ